jgi:hypothetical protein
MTFYFLGSCIIKALKDVEHEANMDALKCIPIWRKVYLGSTVTTNLHDIFKLGDLHFYVSGLKFAHPNDKKNNKFPGFSENKINHKYLNKNDVIYENLYEYQCRICLNSYSSHENFLIALCKCAGSVKYMHYDCLLAWIFSRSDYIEKEYAFIIQTKFKCEICKAPFPS